ncbi:hypothetical protein FX988_00204 [Paraglaciecola mesophila]|uniref:Uncharacterized protein n=1 Tax=Paraglaciecola mesophila TaxID=197222 RepID=A0A857JD89_9ALTE|nr:cohesin domain-containing protein [Paraglaciecola mesophila]QHJ09995.1 hypothetical protein FX988_00204 [Paraglaciecola mesophila]
MKKLIALITLFIGLQAQAGLISLELDSNDVSMGDTIELSIIGSGFSSFDSLSVNVEFDTALFELDESSLGGDLFDTSPFRFVVSSQIFGVALSYLDFAAFMGGDFVIARFNLTATALGQSSFLLSDMVAGEFFSGPLMVISESDPIAVTISATEVSEPNSLAVLLTLGFVLMGVRGLKRK